MAGVGFELRKLFREQGLISNVKAYAFSSVTTIGPMVLCMVMIVIMQWMMVRSGADFLERELFLTTVVYAFIFSVLITGGLSMLLTRFIADMMFLRKHEHLLSSYYGAVAVCLPIGMIVAWTFLHDLSAGFGYKIAAYLLFAELVVIWIQAVHLSALKDYKRIVRNFGYGITIAIGLAYVLLFHTPYDSAAAVLAALDTGFFVVVLMCSIHFEQKFPKRMSRVYFDFLSYFGKFPALFFIGTFLYSGVYIHSFVYWFGQHGARVAEKYAISPFYDLPVFYAYLTVVPTLVTFVVSVETSFYEKFRDYYDRILNSGTFADIERAKKEMQRTLVSEISFIMEVQLLFTVICIAVGIKVLPAIGFTMSQLETFNILVLGYYLFIISFIVLLILLYFDDRKGVLIISGLFVLLNVALSYWAMLRGFDGLGMFTASFIFLVVALSRLVFYVRNIDYYTFCSQPITVKKKTSFWKRLNRKSASHVAAAIAAIMLLSACTNQADSGPEAPVPEKMSESVISAIDSERLIEDKRLYERDEDGSIIALYLTVLPEDPNDDKPVDWYQLNRIQSVMDEGDLRIIMQEGAADGSGPQQGMFGFSSSEANGKISLRGNTTRYNSQRSYKIKLNNQAGLWRDQRVLNLNKSSFDDSRIRNKLSFDIMETLPDMVSLRTQFVRLFVKDLSSGSNSTTGYVDYGLYTHVENPNEMFLKNHWLDPYGQLYKPVFFEFYRYPESIKSQSDPTYDKAAFERYLEIQGREDHDKLIAMLEDVNNLSIPIEDVVAKHFDLDNYLTWLAVNILMDNMDTDAHNFLLYSPLNSMKWYFLPWDYDGGWEDQRSSGSISTYQSGVSNYWGSVLHNRFFRSTNNVQLLKDRVDELYASAINNDTVAQRLQSYQSVLPIIKSPPDSGFLPIEKNALSDELDKIAGVPYRSLQRFLEDMDKPKPFYMSDLLQAEEGYLLDWDPSFDLQGEDLVYDWILAKDPLLTQVVEKRTGLRDTSVTLESLKPGTYYWKVIARDSSGHEQIAFDHYEDTEGEPHYGVREIRVGE